MLLDKKNMTRQYVDQYLLKNQINLEDAIEVSDLDLLIEFSKIGIGIACVIRNFVQDELDQQTLTEVPIPLQIPPRNVGIAYKEQHLKNKALSAFIDFFLA
jgi:DNA-binding transcriptional LysR family regulator